MPLRLVLSVAAGLALWLAFPTHDLWWMAYVGIGALAIATRQVGPWRGALLGFVAGLAYFVPLLSWTGIFVGSLPWLALSVLESLYIALIGALCGWLQRDGVRPLVVALAWVVSEFARATTPFGGFPWARIGFSQADAPLLGVASLLGTPGVTFVAALVGALAALALERALQGREYAGREHAGREHAGSQYAVTHRPAGRPVVGGSVVGGSVGGGPVVGGSVGGGPVVGGSVRAIAATLTAAALLFGPLVIPRPVDGEPLEVLGVQGNVPEMTLEFNAQRRAVLDNHANTTIAAAERVDAGELPAPDLVLWPENSSDIDPLRNADAATIINEAVDTVGVPLIVGAVLSEPVDHVTNASLLYLPGEGVVDRYVKQRPVPFAEYIPYRDFFRIFSDKVDLVARDFVAGDEPGVMTVPITGADDLILGIAICFEVVVDDLMRENVALGAEVLFVPTNNATFGFTDESEQQLAASRVKAVELGRPVVHVSTVGVSGIVQPDGSVHDKTELFTRDIISGSVPRRTDLTLAVQLGPWPEWAALNGLCGILLGAVLTRRRG